MIPRAVVFDLDGTLVDLDVDMAAARSRLRALFAPLGFDAPFRPVLAHIEEAAAVAGGGADRAAWRARALAILDDAECAGAPRAVARPGARQVVAELRRRGWPLGIVTDNGRACVGPALAAAGLDAGGFAAVVTRDDVARPKPDPAGVIAAARAVVPAGGVLWYVGDSPRDAAAARRARTELAGVDVRIAGVLGGRGSAAELAAAGADAILDELAQLMERAL